MRKLSLPSGSTSTIFSETPPIPICGGSWSDLTTTDRLALGTTQRIAVGTSLEWAKMRTARCLNVYNVCAKCTVRIYTVQKMFYTFNTDGLFRVRVVVDVETLFNYIFILFMLTTLCFRDLFLLGRFWTLAIAIGTAFEHKMVVVLY